MNWTIPSEPWCAEVSTIMETFNLCLNEAAHYLCEFGTADAVFDNLTKD